MLPMKHGLKNILHGIMYLNTCSWLLVLFGDIMELLRCGILLKEVRHRKWALRVSGLASLPDLPPSCVHGADISISFLFLPRRLLSAAKPSCRNGLSSLQNSSQKQMFSSLNCFSSWYSITKQKSN